MTVNELGARMSSREFSEWMAYANLEPFGPLRDDMRAGEIAATVANVNRDATKRPEPWTPGDFFPQLRPPVEPIDPEERMRIMAMNLRAMTYRGKAKKAGA